MFLFLGVLEDIRSSTAMQNQEVLAILQQDCHQPEVGHPEEIGHHNKASHQEEVGRQRKVGHQGEVGHPGKGHRKEVGHQSKVARHRNSHASGGLEEQGISVIIYFV